MNQGEAVPALLEHYSCKCKCATYPVFVRFEQCNLHRYVQMQWVVINRRSTGILQE